MQLPFRIEPLQDETVTSWLMRVGRRYRVPIPELLAVVGVARPHAGGDPDFFFYRETLAPLAQAMDVDVDMVERLVLPSEDIPEPSRIDIRYRFFYCAQCWLDALGNSGPFIHRFWIDRRTAICPLHAIVLTCEPRNLFFSSTAELTLVLPAMVERCRRAAAPYQPELYPDGFWDVFGRRFGSRGEVYLDGRHFAYAGWLSAYRFGGDSGPIAGQVGKRLGQITRKPFLLPRLAWFDRYYGAMPVDIFRRPFPPIFRRYPTELVLIDRVTDERSLIPTCDELLGRFCGVTTPDEAMAAHAIPIVSEPEIYREGMSGVGSAAATGYGDPKHASAGERWRIYKEATEILDNIPRAGRAIPNIRFPEVIALARRAKTRRAD